MVYEGKTDGGYEESKRTATERETARGNDLLGLQHLAEITDPTHPMQQNRNKRQRKMESCVVSRRSRVGLLSITHLYSLYCQIIHTRSNGGTTCLLSTVTLEVRHRKQTASRLASPAALSTAVGKQSRNEDVQQIATGPSRAGIAKRCHQHQKLDKLWGKVTDRA